MSTPDVFDDWYRSNYPTVYAAALVASARDAASAEDATSDAFVEAYKKWKHVRTMESPVGWVVRVAVNKVRRSQRRASLRRRLEIRQESSRDLAICAVSDGFEEVWKAVGQLSERQRQAVVLRYVEQLTQIEIADQMGIAPGSVAATLNHARGNLARNIENERKASTP